MDASLRGFDIPDRIDAGEVALRSPVEADVAAIVEACQDPEISRWTRVPCPYGRSDAEHFIELAEAGRRDGDAAPFLIVDPVTDALNGAIGIHDMSRSTLTGEIGYWVASWARGRGIASRALNALADWGLSAGLHRIQAQVMVGNESSRRVLSRAGFVEEGLLRSVSAGGCGVDLDRIDMHVYSLIPSDRV
jgi:RimJ/RimL family protein N-acetyltransferase